MTYRLIILLSMMVFIPTKAMSQELTEQQSTECAPIVKKANKCQLTLFELNYVATKMAEDFEHYQDLSKQKDTYFEKVISEYEEEKTETNRWKNNKKTWGAGGIILGAVVGLLFGKFVL